MPARRARGIRDGGAAPPGPPARLVLVRSGLDLHRLLDDAPAQRFHPSTQRDLTIQVQAACTTSSGPSEGRP